MIPVGFLQGRCSSDWHLQNAEQGKLSSLQGHREVAHFIQFCNFLPCD